jgi:hypothetical protein
MKGDRAVLPAAPVLLVGSVPLDDSEAVFRALAKHLGPAASRYPDGETKERTNWVRWQRHLFDSNTDLVLTGPRKLPGFQDNLTRPFYALREGIDPTQLRFGEMGYAAKAIESHRVFTRLRESGAIPAGLRFQVSLPTVVSLLTVFVALEDRTHVEPALEAAMRREVERIAAAIPPNELAIQWDFCHEVVGHDGGIALHFDNILENATQRLCGLLDCIPADVEAGVHLCYGDPGHKHVIEPKDCGTCVDFTTRILTKSPRNVTWVHIPIPRAWDDFQFYKPLSLLKDASTQIYLGLVHYTDGVEGTLQRIGLARNALPTFGIATECGFGRRDPATVPQLLDIHRATAMVVH